MRDMRLSVVAAVALAASWGLAWANPLGVPPNAKPIEVVEGHGVSIDLGTPPAHGWYVLVWGSYKVGDKEFFAAGSAQEGVNDPKTGCVFLVMTEGNQCFYPSESQNNKAHEFLKPVKSGKAVTLSLEPPAGARGTLYYRVDFAM